MKYVITGTSSGLGFELANRLIEHGDVIGLSRRTCELRVNSPSHLFKQHRVDLSSIEDVYRLTSCVKFLYDTKNESEITLIFNAGLFYSGPERLSKTKRDELFNVNVFSIMDIMDKLGQNNLRRVVFINSISGLKGQAEQHEYVASKHALMGYVKSLFTEANKKPYDIISINPGGINTELWKNYPEVDPSKFIPVSKLADLVVELVMIKERIYIPSLVILPEIDV